MSGRARSTHEMCVIAHKFSAAMGRGIEVEVVLGGRPQKVVRGMVTRRWTFRPPADARGARSNLRVLVGGEVVDVEQVETVRAARRR